MTQKHTATLYSERVELVTHYTSDRVLVIQRHALVTHYTSDRVLVIQRHALVTHYTSDRVLVIQRHALVTHYTSDRVLVIQRHALVTHYTSDRVLVIQRHALVTHYTSDREVCMHGGSVYGLSFYIRLRCQHSKNAKQNTPHASGFLSFISKWCRSMSCLAVNTNTATVCCHDRLEGRLMEFL